MDDFDECLLAHQVSGNEECCEPFSAIGLVSNFNRGCFVSVLVKRLWNI